MLCRTALRWGTLVKIGRGAGNVTESASNALLESLQSHGYCYIQHPYIQRSILDQLHRDCRVFFEQYVLRAQGEPAARAGPPHRGGRPHPTPTPLSEYELESLRTPYGFRGYYRYVGASGVDDAIDCFSIGRDDVAEPAELRRAYYVQSGWEEHEYLPLISRRNPWEVLLNHANEPAAGLHSNFMSDFKDMLVAYYELCAAVSLDVLRHVSCGLGIRPSIPTGGVDPGQDYDLDYFTPFHDKRDCDLQAKYYPRLGHATRVRQGVAIQGAQSAQNPGGVRVLRRKGARTQPLSTANDEEDGQGEPISRLDPHKDLSTITLLAQDSMGGLEVWDDARESFVAVPVLEDALLVNAGVFLERWSGGLIEATPHRVKNVAKGQGRCSIVFFAMPDHDARIEPLLQQDENPATDAQDSFLAGDLMPTH